MKNLNYDKSNYSLFLDDERYPVKVTWVTLPLVEWTIVRNYKQFVEKISTDGLPNFITFDHDLGPEHYNDFDLGRDGKWFINYDKYSEKTGYHCAQWLVKYCLEYGLDVPEYIVHSMNPIGKDNIKSVIEGYKLWKKSQN